MLLLPKPQMKMSRCRSEGTKAPQRLPRTNRKIMIPVEPLTATASPESVVTYMGRSYSFSDLCPDRDASECMEGDGSEHSTGEDNNECEVKDQPMLQQQEEEEAPIKRIITPLQIPRRPLAPGISPPAIDRRKRIPVTRAKSSSVALEMMRAKPTRRRPARSKSSEGLAQMVAASREEQPKPGLLRSTTLNAVKSLIGKNDDDVEIEKFGVHAITVRTLNYTQGDVANICNDHEEFVRLKAALKKKGAITNEVLKQGLHFYVAAKKDREASVDRSGTPTRRRRRKRSTRRTLSEEAVTTESVVPLRRNGTTGTIL